MPGETRWTLGPGPGFGGLWTAAAVSNLGDGVALTAFPLLVASLTRDPLLVALATVAGQIPWLLFSLPAGALVDRVDRRLAMVSADAVRAVVVAILAVFVLLGQAQLWAVYAVAFALATAETVFDPASEAILPHLVERDALPGANARLQGTSWALNNFVGPPVGASLFALVAAAPFLIDSASFVAAALIVLTLPGTYRPARVAPGRSVLAESRDGLRWLFAHPVLRYTSPMAGLTNVATFAIVAVFVLFALDVVGVGDVGYGFLVSALGIGGLAGAVTAGAIISAIGLAGALRLPAWLGAGTAAVIALVPHPAVVALGLFTFAFSTSLWNVAHVSLRQRLVPDELRGRVAGCNRLITSGAQPVGAALGGAAAAIFGLRAPFALAALLLVGVGLLALARVSPVAIDAVRPDPELPVHAGR